MAYPQITINLHLNLISLSKEKNNEKNEGKVSKSSMVIELIVRNTDFVTGKICPDSSYGMLVIIEKIWFQSVVLVAW